MCEINSTTIQLAGENKILRAFFVEKLMQDGFNLKSTTLHQLKDKAEKLGLDPKEVIDVVGPLFIEATQRIFTSKKEKDKV